MPYYVIQIQTGMESRFIQSAAQYPPDERIQLYWPRRLLKERKAGKWRNSEKSIFPGYLFIEADEVIQPLFYRLKRVKGFIRYLANNRTIRPLTGPDRDILLHFLSFGEVVGQSLVVFDKNDRIKVKSGPLIGLEGYIVKVNRRKKRAKIKLNLYESSFLIDFGFEYLENLL